MGLGRQLVQVWWLYRLYTRGGERLYVGISGDVDRRIDQHKLDKDWGPLIDDTRTERFLLRKGEAVPQWRVESTEKEKIQERGGTLGNVQHNVKDQARIDVLLAELAGVELPVTPRPRPVPVVATGWSFTRWAIGVVPMAVIGTGALALALWVAVFGGRWTTGPKVSGNKYPTTEGAKL